MKKVQSCRDYLTQEFEMNHIDFAQSDRKPIHIEGYGLSISDDRKPIHTEEDWGF